MYAAGVFITGASFLSRSSLRVSLIITVVHHVSETPLPAGILLCSGIYLRLGVKLHFRVSAFTVSIFYFSFTPL